MKRLVDDFKAMLPNQSDAIPITIEICYSFGDLLWDVADTRPIMSVLCTDPAFTIRSSTHLLAFHRMQNEIRYYLGYLPYGPSKYEIGVVESVREAVELALAFLQGEGLSEIEVPRQPRMKLC